MDTSPNRKLKLPASSRIVSVIIPCFQEEESLPTLFSRLQALETSIDSTELEIEIIIIDDGSTDRTWEILLGELGSKQSVQLIKHERNIGYGEALRTGFHSARGELIVTIDADTNYDLRDIPKILDHLDEEVVLVTASPFIDEGSWNYPLYRFLLSRALIFLYRFVLGKKAGNIRTFTCGFRVYRRSFLEDVPPYSNNFIANAEILTYALLSGFRIKEMPAHMSNRHHGLSKLKICSTMISHLKFLWKVWRGLICAGQRKVEIN